MSETNRHKGPEFTAPSIEVDKNRETYSAPGEHGEIHINAPEHSIEELATKIDTEAKSSTEYAQEEKNNETQHPALVNMQLKDMAYSRALVRTRKHLSVPAKMFSRVIHSKILDKPSEAIGKTIARPSGMVGGAVFAFFGTSLLLWTTKKYGYEYNYLAATLLFIIGMIFGIVTESLLKLLKKRRQL
jgi:hypothetical protein